jgi:hypothetical protein
VLEVRTTLQYYWHKLPACTAANNWYLLLLLVNSCVQALLKWIHGYKSSADHLAYISSSVYWTAAYTLADLEVTEGRQQQQLLQQRRYRPKQQNTCGCPNVGYGYSFLTRAAKEAEHTHIREGAVTTQQSMANTMSFCCCLVAVAC